MYENGALREVMEAVFKACGGWVPRSPNDRPTLAVYMRHDYWRECMAQRGQLSGDTYDFMQSHVRGEQTLMGFPVYRVDSDNHPKYRIYVDEL